MKLNVTERGFQCSKCGCCCVRAGRLGLMPSREDGACINLAEDNTCKIYETRPDFCRVNVMAERNRAKFGLSQADYYKLNNMICNKWMDEDGIDESFRIKI